MDKFELELDQEDVMRLLPRRQLPTVINRWRPPLQVG
ncbi:hypothetical protein LINPERHAP2_LOCUS42213 [Linum perenne]